MRQLHVLQNQSWLGARYLVNQSLINQPQKLQTFTPFLPADALQFLQKRVARDIEINQMELVNKTFANKDSDTAKYHSKMYITVDTRWVTALRQIVMTTFNNVISSIRIQPIAHARKMKICLYFASPIEDKLMAAIMLNLPSAEFGRITTT